MKKILVISAITLVSAFAKGQDVLVIHYAIRPPFVVSDPENTVGGLVAGPIVKALQKAGIPYRLKQTPTSRQMKLLESNTGVECAMGWYKNEAREKFAQFTEPIFSGGSWLLIANKSTVLQPVEEFSRLIQERTLRLLVKDMYSYGSYIDGELAKKSKFIIERRVAESNVMMKMVSAGRADAMVTSEEEAQSLFASGNRTNLQIVHLSDAQKGEKRYLLCTRKVPLQIITQFNAALRK